MTTGGLILASFDSRMQGRDSEDFAPFIPMLPLDGSTVIKREIHTFRKAGLSPIFVVSGYQDSVLKNHLSHNHVIFLEDPDFEKHDGNGSLGAALEKVWAYCDRVISVPVDRPMFSVSSVMQLLDSEKSARAAFKGEGELRLHVMGDDGGQESIFETDDEGLICRVDDEDGMKKAALYARKIRDDKALSAHVKVVLKRDEDFFGPGIMRLMELIQAKGSIQAAAAEMGMSYSKAWKMVNKAEKQLGFTLVVRLNGGRNGGSSKLTGEGREFMARYRAMCADLGRAADNIFDAYFGEFQ